MSSIALDQATIEKLQSAGTQVQIVDPQGKIVGTFRPAPRVYKRGEVPAFNDEELNHAFNESPRITTAELLRRLEEQK